LVFGAGGQLGRHLLEAPVEPGIEIVGLTRAEADICDETAVEAAITKLAPTSIVNAGAYTAVDKAESEVAQALRVNRDGARLLAKAAAEAGIPFVHLSTDYVFDGRSRTPYTETDPVAPQGSYARSKEEGERAVRAAADKHLILRTAWVYGPFGVNFMRTMLRLGAEREELGIVDDQTGCPTATGDIAAAILSMIETAERPGFADWGTFHYVGGDVVTWYGFAGMIFAEAKRFGQKSPRLRPITTADYPTPAHRPAYSVLSTAKLERVFGVRPMPLRESLVASLERLFN
jgi:dTDP-4-dehydrorhamnose reductase